jgi:hypothetical protein
MVRRCTNSGTIYFAPTEIKRGTYRRSYVTPFFVSKWQMPGTKHLLVVSEPTELLSSYLHGRGTRFRGNWARSVRLGVLYQ